MALTRSQGQDIRTGVFVIAGVIVLFIVLISVPSFTGPKMTLTSVQFPFEGGVVGIEPGTPITLGGLNVGTVQAVTFKPAVGGQAPYFQVSCSVQATLMVPRTATVTVNQSPIGAGAILAINLPTSSASFSLDPSPDDGMMGVAPNLSSLALVFGQERATGIVNSYETFSKFNLGSPTTDLKERLQTGANNLSAIKTDFNIDYEMWRVQGNSIQDGYDTASAKFDEIYGLFGPGKILDQEKIQPAFDRIKSNLSTSGELISTLQKRWDDEILPPLADLIDRFKKDCAIIERNYESTLNILQDAKDSLGNAKADMQITGVQLNRTVREITLMPWTLLGGAFEDKGEQAQFKKIALELVRSTTELNLAIDFTRQLLDQDPKLAVRYPELIELLNQWITRAGANQNVASQEILNRLLEPAKP